MSVAKPFTFALVCESIGPDRCREPVGLDATGLPFDSLEEIERRADATNPMVNAAAIGTIALIPGHDADQRWRFLRDGLSRFASGELELDDEIYASATATNFRYRSAACRRARGARDVRGAPGRRREQRQGHARGAPPVGRARDGTADLAPGARVERARQESNTPLFWKKGVRSVVPPGRR